MEAMTRHFGSQLSLTCGGWHGCQPT
jgi:hypothetical protein